MLRDSISFRAGDEYDIQSVVCVAQGVTHCSPSMCKIVEFRPNILSFALLQDTDRESVPLIFGRRLSEFSFGFWVQHRILNFCFVVFWIDHSQSAESVLLVADKNLRISKQLHCMHLTRSFIIDTTFLYSSVL